MYRIYDGDDQLLYIGITVDIKTRLNHHRKKPWWQEVARIDVDDAYLDRASALEAETLAIGTENPTWNVRKRSIPVS